MEKKYKVMFGTDLIEENVFSIHDNTWWGGSILQEGCKSPTKRPCLFNVKNIDNMST